MKTLFYYLIRSHATLKTTDRNAFNDGLSNAQTGLIKIELKGTVFTVSSKISKEITGVYLCERKGEPKIILNADGTGSFQPHDVDPISIKYWIDCDENGVLKKKEGINGKYQYTILSIFRWA